MISISYFSYGQTKIFIRNPLTHFIGDDKDTSWRRTIHKLVFDFNSDGRSDIALSSSESWGNAGGTWGFYFKAKNNMYYYYDEIEVLHPKAYSIQINYKKPNVLILYHRMSCCEGFLNYYEITPKGFKFKKSKEYGEGKELSNDDKLGRELSKGREGIWKRADLKCLILNKNHCWN